MDTYVVDTHALAWFISEDKLGIENVSPHVSPEPLYDRIKYPPKAITLTIIYKSLVYWSS